MRKEEENKNMKKRMKEKDKGLKQIKYLVL